MLDLHVLTLPGSNREWFAQCLDSIYAAVRVAGFPVSVHVIEGVQGHIGLGRKDGYSRGTHPYVTFVDDDDWIAEEALYSLAPAMGDGATAIFTGETRVMPEGAAMDCPLVTHHLAVYQRGLTSMIRWEDHPHGGDRVLASLVIPYAARVNKALYYHRIGHGSAASKLRVSHG